MSPVIQGPSGAPIIIDEEEDTSGPTGPEKPPDDVPTYPIDDPWEPPTTGPSGAPILDPRDPPLGYTEPEPKPQPTPDPPKSPSGGLILD